MSVVTSSSTSPLEFEVLPECGIRNEKCEFVLGMPLNQTIAVLQKQNRLLRSVDLLYCNEDPAGKDITLVLVQQGIRFVFNARSQRLKLIEIFEFHGTILNYCSNHFSEPSDVATVAKIEQCFGATHPGVYDSEQRVYILSWRGLCFTFPFESDDVQPTYAHGLGSLTFPNGSPKLSKMAIFSGASLAEAKTVAVPWFCYTGSCLLELARVLVSSTGRVLGLHVAFTAETASTHRTESVLESATRSLLFGQHEQMVRSALGAPDRIFYKCEDKMRIHRTQSNTERDSAKDKAHVDYFYNYFTLGFDILFCGRTHSVKKFILHTNYPGHYNFSIYNRCFFEMVLEESNKDKQESQSPKTKRITVTAFTKWSELSAYVSSGCELDGGQCQPVVLNRLTSNTNDNPFGSTFCYGYAQCIFEVMANGHLSSVTLFEIDEKEKCNE